MRRVVLPCFLAGLGLLASVGTAAAADREPQGPPPAGYIADEVLVRFKPGVDGSERAAVRRRQGAQVESVLDVPRVQLLDLEAGMTVREAVAAFERDPRVEYAEPNYRVAARVVPNDPEWSKLWGLHNLGVPGGLADADIDAPEAWDVLTDASSVTVGVVDTGVAPNHPDLLTRLVAGKDWVHNDFAPGDLDGHGTHVAGTVGAAGANALGVTGVAWDTRLMPLRVLDNTGSGSFADVSSAFAYAGQNGVAVVNASLGGYVSGSALDTLRASIEGSPGTLFVVAAGNATTDLDAGNPDYPCSLALDNVLCVAASDKSDAPSSFTNYGSTSVDLAAPGSSVYSTTPGVAVTWDERFEGGLGAWTAGSDEGDTPTWAISTANGDFSEGAAGLVDSPGGTYANDSDTFVRTTAAVPVATDCDLWFDLDLDLADGSDRFYVQASDSATGPWTTLYSRNTDTAGVETPVVDFRSTLHDFYGHNVYLRFRLRSDSSGTADGAMVDYIEVRCHGGESYGFNSGTSMASPHVAGAAALVLAKSIVDGDPLTPVELKQRLLSTADPLSCWDGLTVTGARLNLARALQPGGDFGPGAAGCPTTITRQVPDPAPAPQPPAPPAPQPAPPTGTGNTTPVPLDITPPVVTASAARRYRAATLLRNGLRARIGCDEACSLRTDVLIGRRTAKKLGITGRRFGRSYILLGRARSALTAGSRTITTRISRRAHRGLRRARSVALVLRVVAADQRGNDSVTRRSFTVR